MWVGLRPNVQCLCIRGAPDKLRAVLGIPTICLLSKASFGPFTLRRLPAQRSETEYEEQVCPMYASARSGVYMRVGKR